MNLFTTMSAGSCFKSFISLNEFASSCHTSLANFSLSHTKEPELLSLAVMKTTWISWNTLKWNFCGISWTYSAWQPGSLGQSASTQDRGSTDAFSHRVLQGSVAVFYRSERTSRRKDGLGEWFCCTSSVWPWSKPVYQAELRRGWYFLTLCGNTLMSDLGCLHGAQTESFAHGYMQISSDRKTVSCGKRGAYLGILTY